MSVGCYYGPLETWKVVYYPRELNGGVMGVALVEADCQQQAMRAFREQYAGQYSTIQSCKKLLG
jgi:hypothetical protein